MHRRHRSGFDDLQRRTLGSPTTFRRSYPTDRDLARDKIELYTSHAPRIDHIKDVEVVNLAELSPPSAPPAPRSSQPQRSRRTLKAQRQSQPGSILYSTPEEVQSLYLISPLGKTDLSYANPQRRKLGGLPRRQSNPSSKPRSLEPVQGPVSLYTVLSRHLRAVTAAPEAKSDLELSSSELTFLASHGYTTRNLEQWINCVISKSSTDAVAIFKSRNESPPLFLVLLFLRRKLMKASALHIVIEHLGARLQRETISWASLQLLCTRLLRHARVLQPEFAPWVASLYSFQAMRIYKTIRDSERLPHRMISDLTHFSNVMLSLISLPASIRPMLASRHQEKAQFEVLRFMASCSPPLVVHRSGFRATVRNQLAHPKTSQELEWAMLKGPSWPPWKENRTAMDEEKGYDFGASRASRILHHMFEAGYRGQIWEDVAQLYAGWDTDLSPTIQTRTLLAYERTKRTNERELKPLLWAARVRTARTRREAWACLLAYEASDSPSSPEAYLAMCEKLHYPEARQQSSGARHEHSDLERPPVRPLLPGDMKEAGPDPKSPLHLVHLSESVPTYEQLYHRMMAKGIRPTRRSLAFLVETLPDLSLVLELLEKNQARFNGGIQHLLEGSFLEPSPVPNYFLASFIRFLCRFGRFSDGPTSTFKVTSPQDHKRRLKQDLSYLIEYAQALLTNLQPAYRPAWTAYMQHVLFGHREKGAPSAAVEQYAIMCNLLEKMNEVGLDPDDEQLRLLCTVVRYAAQCNLKGQLPRDDARHIMSTAPRLLRTIFQALVVVNSHPSSSSLGQDENLLPPHVPDPSTLHAYVRALGMLRDYEGLYSFSTWATTYHAEVTSRAKAQHSGPQALFRTLVALRAALEGKLEHGQEGASRELTELVKTQIDGVEEWEWPSDHHVDLYTKKYLRSSTPTLPERD